jgi:serine/threonine protein phosphatase 1|uniref:Serine/threonine protein phosphatase n=1 Tax=Desulfobacca acetoxidans TaxID=60893 RepID=A0A7C3SK59_9BACT
MTDIFAIGDIHGCLDHLERLLEAVNPDLHRHRLVFIGDYIDRGPNSKGVVDFIIRLKKLYPAENIICLKGNHEAMFLDFLNGIEPELFLFNGGRSTLREYWGEHWYRLKKLRLPAEHKEFYLNLKKYYETPDYIFVHGGLKPGVPLEEQKEEDLLWIRGEFIASFEDFGKRVIFGHTPMRYPLVMPNKIGIDTGCVYGNFLTCLRLPAEEFYFAGLE